MPMHNVMGPQLSAGPVIVNSHVHGQQGNNLYRGNMKITDGHYVEAVYGRSGSPRPQ